MKNVGDLCREVAIDKKIRERKSLGSFRLRSRVGKLKKKECFCGELQIQKWIAFQCGLEGSCAFLFKSLRFTSDLNIHVSGSKLLEEVFELLMPNDGGSEFSIHTYS